MIMITGPLPKPEPAPLDVVAAAWTAVRILRQRAETDTMTQDAFERELKRVEKALTVAEVALASAPQAHQPFTVIQGGRRG
jgi:hypothetical protein